MKTALLLGVGLSFIVYSLFTASPILAQAPIPPSPSPAPSVNPGNSPEPITAENYKAPQNAHYTVVNLGHAIFCEGAGRGLIKNQKCVGLEGGEKPTLYTYLPGGGALGGLNTAMAYMFVNPPLSDKQYLAEIGNQLGLVDDAYAQVAGSGEGVIKPVLKVWQVTRNLAYLMFILVFLAVGFMIMFKQKLNPQTVISIQSALPGLVVGLILVTFSYFIAALLVDLSFVGMQLVAYLFQQTGLPQFDPQGVQSLAKNGNVFSFLGAISKTSLLGDLTVGLGDFARNIIPAGARQAIGTGALGPAGLALNFIPVLGTTITRTIGDVLVTGVGGIIGIFLAVVLLIGLIIQMFRLLWGLIRAYISILAITIAGPLIILYSSIPGKGGALSFWWKTILANVLIFPAVFATFLFAGLFLGNTNPSDFQSTLPLFAGIPVDLLRVIIGYGIILGLPAVPQMVKDAMGVKDIKGLPEAAMAGAAAGYGTLTGGARRGYSMGMRSTGLASLQEAEERLRLQNYQNATTTPAILDNMRRFVRWLPKP